MQPKIPLVHAAAVSKASARHDAAGAIFADMTVTLPTDRICAVLGRAGTGRSTFLRLLSGAERPDRGAIHSNAKFSIVGNAGLFFHAGMTGLENITFAARLYGLDSELLTETVLALADFGDQWQVPAGALTGRVRKPMEMLLAALLPFDCYLLDDVERADPEILACVLELLRRRQCGMIFTAHNPKLARQYATFCGVVANQTIRAFDSVEEALNYYV